jgi:PKD repeat protein
VEIVNYSWTFTDGSIITLYGSNPSYRFENVGNFRVTLNVRDEKGNFHEDIVWINVTELVTSGSISGIITDSDGTPVAGAQVSVEGTSFSTTTDGTGSYLIEDVPAGNYNILVSREKYKDRMIDNVLVIAGEATSNDPVTLSKEQTSSSTDSDSIVWILLIIVIIVIVLVIFLIARPKKETEIVEEVIEELSFLCPECGTMVNYDMKKCPGCGVEFGEGGEEEVGEPKESPADIYMCPSCGSFVSSHAATCEKCGFIFDEDSPPQKKDEEEVTIPEGFLGGGVAKSNDQDKGAKKEFHGVNIPSEITERVARQVEELINENGFELEETELELEVELEGDLTSEEKKKETKEILDLFKNEFNSDDSGKDSDALTKEIDDILEKSKKAKEEDDVEITDDEE